MKEAGIDRSAVVSPASKPARGGLECRCYTLGRNTYPGRCLSKAAAGVGETLNR